MEEGLLEAVRASCTGSVKICSDCRLAEDYSLGAKMLEDLSSQDLSDAWEVEEGLFGAVQASCIGSMETCSDFRPAEIHSLRARVMEV
jgi:hypothetical protein